MVSNESVRTPEILAPAGDFERLKVAILYGADAVYLAGTEFGMRTAPSNFNNDELKKAVKYAHINNVKVYVTCNTFPRNNEIENMPEYLEFLESISVDALIVADLGVFSLAKKHAPNTDIHISTQAGIVNYESANYFYNQGAKRIVLAREMSVEEIADLHSKIPKALEIETFVHGAMCMAVSGRCMLSAYMVDRNANSGDCAQPCRWKYDLVEHKRPDTLYSAEDDGKNTFIFNANDMNMIEHLPELYHAGVTSFKIEGRAKAEYYAAITTNAYREAMDGFVSSGYDKNYIVEPWVVEETYKVSHRPYGTGFYFDAPAQNTKTGGYIRDYTVAGVIEGYEDGYLIISQRNNFKRGAVLDILEPGEKPIFLSTEILVDEKGQDVEVARHPMMILKIPYDKPLKVGSYCRMRME